MSKTSLFYSSSSVEETRIIARKILDACENSKIFAIFGELGAGKTTLVRYLCEALEVEDEVKSPTFSLVNEYHYSDGLVYHFDFYRIKDISEAYGLGYEEYFFSGEYCFIEWPEMIEELIPEEAVVLRIEATGESEREFRIEN